MSWRDQMEPLVEVLLRTLTADGLLILLAGIAISIALAVGLTWRRRSRRHRDDGEADPVGFADGDEDHELTPAPADRVLPLGRVGFLVLVVAVSAFCWGLGYTLAGSKEQFLASREWQFQPFYVAAHLATLRLFVAVFARNYRRGIAALNVPPDQALASMHRILGPWGAGAALLVALPFCISDFRYLNGDRYERLDAQVPLGAIDYVMWGIWSLEWFLNAFIWVILVGFLVRNMRTLRAYDFVAPVERVLQEKQYRPFLRMSSQGATVVLGFGILTVLYIAYTGGAVTDYLGLGITASLLIIGFVVPLVMLRRKVREIVTAEQVRLHAALTEHGARVTGVPLAEAADLGSLASRLDYVVSLLRISHLDGLHTQLGATEVRAVVIRLLAPALTIGWQLAQQYKSMIGQYNQLLQTLLTKLGFLAG